MLTYFISQSNSYTIRTVANTQTDLTMSLQDMTTLTNTTASLSGISINDYESLLSFTASISEAVQGQEYRAELSATGNNEPIWNGSFNVFHSQSHDKPKYKPQIPLDEELKSHTSTNEYIIIT